MNGERIYIVIPRNLDSTKPPFKFNMTCGRMAAHAAHAAAILARSSGIDVGDKDIIILSVGNSQDLENLCFDLNRNRIKFVEYRDVDKGFEGELLTAIATWPIAKDQ